MQQPLKLYISYSNKDKSYRDKLLNHLNGLVNKGQIEIWSDHLLQAGEEFMKTFQRELAQMDIWVVLISPDSLSSDFIWKKEYAVAHERQVPIIPVLLRPALWESSPIEKLFILPSFAKAVTKWDDEDEAFLDIVNGISKMVTTKLNAKGSKKEEEPISSASPAIPKSIPKTNTTPTLKTIKIFLASSSELKEDRDAFDLYFRQQNDHLLEEKGVYLKIVRWENFLDVMSETRLQDEYNKEVRACDIFVSLFFTKTGKYTEEEFNVAHNQFKEKKKPHIFTFFKKPDIVASKDKQKDLISLWNFQEKLENLGHFHTNFDSTEHLKRQFRDQLDKLLREGKI